MWNYLRVRGEYHDFTLRAQRVQELPPRTRRIPPQARSWWPWWGTTSAYAENTNGGGERPRPARNYLRVRGEYSIGDRVYDYPRELPPRTRRIQGMGVDEYAALGTTSAYAENTRGGVLPPHPKRELPPRTRRIQANPDALSNLLGTTSAYAENTLLYSALYTLA